MGKLGKKARKFKNKNLQSVLRNRRKNKAKFKKRHPSKNKQDKVDNQQENAVELSNTRSAGGEDAINTSLETVFAKDDSDLFSAASDSDGFLSEDSSCPQLVESENRSDLGNNEISSLSMDNKEILKVLSVKQKKLNKLKKKDPEFAKYLESCIKDGMFENEEMHSDEDGTSTRRMQLDDEKSAKEKLLTSNAITSLCRLVTEEESEPALISLINAYRAACHFGTEPVGLSNGVSCPRIQNSNTFCDIHMFMLNEADNIFRGLLKIPSVNCKKETILEMKNSSKWKKMKPLLKSYLRSTLFLLKQVTDPEILVFSLTRLRASIVFFAAFPSLLHSLIKIIIPFWATGEGNLSSSSYLLMREVASLFSADCFDTCLIRTYKAYIARCRNLEVVDVKQIEFLRSSFVELCSLDVQKSCSKALVSVRQLVNILQLALLKNNKEAVKKICSWQYTKCIDIWVLFISSNIQDHDIQTLFYITIQLINGVACLFSGPRYMPLRVKCVHWLNELSRSSGVFIPVTSLVLDILEYKIGKEGGKNGQAVNFGSLLRLPKYWLKSHKFKEWCVLSAVELLSMHFVQWSYHISFPELATIPLIRLRKFHDSTAIESFRRLVKRMIDQVEQNVEFVQKKRDEVAFSPKDHQSVETFLQFEKGNMNAPFIQYYRSIVEKANLKIPHMNEIISVLELKKSKRKGGHLPNDTADIGRTSDAEKPRSSVDGKTVSRKTRRRVQKE